jgi:hypothetical protein
MKRLDISALQVARYSVVIVSFGAPIDEVANQTEERECRKDDDADDER